MIHLKVSDCLSVCQGKLICGSEELELTHFSNDTRTIQEKDVYLGIQGENFDGNSFYLEALKKGASCCILDRFDEKTLPPEYKQRTIILVKDTVDAIQKLASYKRSLLSIPVIAVTGSAGKTSTKDMIAEVLRQKYTVFKTPGNLNGQIGLPLSLLELQDEEVLVLEMGMNDFGQIAKLTRIAKPTIGVITNIGTAHIGILGSQENILKAKLELLEGMDYGSTLIINDDDSLLTTINLPNYVIKRCTMMKSTGDYQVSKVTIQNAKSQYHVSYRNGEGQMELPFIGNAFIMDSLLALAVGDQLKVSLSFIQKGFHHFKLTGNRMEMINHGGITILNDTYNSNYEALVNALDILKKTMGHRKIAILGDVLELNEYAPKIHYDIGLIPDLKAVDLLFLYGENAKFIKEGALALGLEKEQVFYFDDKDSLVSAILKKIKKDDVILVKASHGMHFDSIVEKIKESYLE